ncbi:SDR family NAD(P)-dependent oxidoreductase [Pedobacter hartonius]|uniref:SDR family NAD(P)-dependent oxidoreductase n=1 Tax=Pedobacter hartonius TaxID=425514 RepID=UPI001587F680|nr:SDR family NAD(P)-dependent oxidoreductase [Pedobacter hartonius]
MLKDKTIVITGASSGAGKAISLEFALQQPNLVLAARNNDALNEVAEECRTSDGRAVRRNPDGCTSSDH